MAGENLSESTRVTITISEWKRKIEAGEITPLNATNYKIVPDPDGEDYGVDTSVAERLTTMDLYNLVSKKANAINGEAGLRLETVFDNPITEVPIVGAGNVTVTSDATGKILVSSSGDSDSHTDDPDQIRTAMPMNLYKMSTSSHGHVHQVEAVTLGDGITMDNTNKIKHTNAIEPGVAQGSATATLGNGGSFQIPAVRYDAQGHIIDKGTTTMTLPTYSANNGVQITGGTLISHTNAISPSTAKGSDTFTADNGDSFDIPTVSYDAQGHVTGKGTTTVTLPEFAASDGIKIDEDGLTFKHTNTITAGTAEGTDTSTLANGGSFTTPTVSYDAQGHVTGKGTHTITLPTFAADDGIKIDTDGLTFKHTNNITPGTAKGSEGVTIENGGTIDLPTVTWDKHGHVTGNSSTTVTLPEYDATDGIEIDTDGLTFKHTNSITAGTASGSATSTLANGGSFQIPTVSYDAQGHVTGKGTTTITNPTFAAGDGIKIDTDGLTFKHTNAVTAGTASGTATSTLGNGGSFTTPTVTYDAQGHVTNKGTNTITLPTFKAGDGVKIDTDGLTFKHTNAIAPGTAQGTGTSTIENGGSFTTPTVTWDAQGHVTGSGSNTITLPEYAATDGIEIDEDGLTFKHTNAITAGTAQGTATSTLANGGSFTTPTVTYDAQGHITAKGTNTITLPEFAADGGIEIGEDGLTFMHTNNVTAGTASGTSTSTIGNGGSFSIPTISYDKHGHIVTKGTTTITTPTFGAGDGIKLDGLNFKHTNAITAGTASGTATSTLGNGGSFDIPTITYDAQGHITDKGTTKITLPTYTGSNGVTVSGTSITNSGVRSIATGTANGTISVNTNGTSANVAVKGLGSSAYMDTTDTYSSTGTTPTSGKAVAQAIGTVTALMGSNNGIATLDSSGKIPSSQIPGSYDDVLNFDTVDDFPDTGEEGKIYVAKATNTQYRWGGESYIPIGSHLALGETSSTAYRGDRGAVAYTHATDSARNTTAKSEALYAIGITAHGHVGSSTAITAGTGISLSSNKISHTNSVTAGTASGSATATIGNGGSFSIPTISYDAQGHVTGKGTTTITIPTYAADTGIKLNGLTFQHTNAITAGTASGSATKTLTFGDTFTIPTVSYDAQGHVTGKGTTTMTMPSLGTSATTAAYGNHTHATSIAASSATNQINLAASTKYALNAGGTSYVFTTPADTHWTSHLYAGASDGNANAATTNGNTYLIICDNGTARDRRKIAGAGGTTVTSDTDGNITITSPALGTGASNAAYGNHTHGITLATDTGTSAITLSPSTKYKLTAGGQSIIFTTPINSTYTVNNGTLTIQGNGTNLGTFTANQAGNSTINITPDNIGAAAASHGNHVPATQTANNAVFLRNDNTWATVTPANIGAAAASHGNHVPATQTANNAVFLRNDNTWATVTPANIGAAASSHNHDSAYAAKSHTHNYAGSASAGGPATNVAGTYSGNGGQLTPSAIANATVRFAMMNNPKGVTGFPTYADCILMDTYSGSDVPWSTGLGIIKQDAAPRMFLFNGAKGNTTTWKNINEVLTTSNYSSYAAAKSHGNHVPATQTANNAIFLRNDNTWATVTPANIGAAAASHGNHVPTTQTANNAIFLRNDNTWQTVTPANIGAAPSGHNHDTVYTHKFHYGGTGNTTKIKIKINSTTSWMLSFVVTLYQGYRATSVLISGYQYGNSHWYSPTAVVLGDSSNAAINVYFGYDSANNLWVGFDGGQYTGVSIGNVTNGYTQIDNFAGLFTISNVSSLTTLQTTVTAQPPSLKGHTHTVSQITDLPTISDSATNSTLVKRTSSGYIFATYLNQSSGAETPTTSSYIIYANSDGYLRKSSLANIKTILGLGSAAYTASTAYASASHNHDSAYEAKGHTHPLSIATSSGTNQISLAANTKYQLTAGGSTYIFTTPPDTNTNNAVTQTATSTNANYEVLFSVTADNTTRTEGARKNSNLLFNPSTGNLQVTQINGVTVGTSPKFTDTTYSSQAAASGGTALSLVTTGEKYTWNNKSNLTIGTTATTAAAGNHTHSGYASSSHDHHSTSYETQALRHLASGTAAATTTNCPSGAWYGYHS